MMLDGQVALVTGGGQGIGRAIVLRFAREEADIAVLDVNRETAEAAGQSGFITGATVSIDGGAVAAGAYMVEKYRRRKAAAAENESRD